jgi:hypothetical protein
MKGMKPENRQFIMTVVACLESTEKNIHETLTR